MLPTPSSTTPVVVSTMVISVRNCELTVLKNRSIFPRPCGRYGFECVSRIPRRAQVRARDSPAINSGHAASAN